MPSYEYEVVDEIGTKYGTFSELQYALLFVDVLFDKYFNELLKITIIKKEKTRCTGVNVDGK